MYSSDKCSRCPRRSTRRLGPSQAEVPTSHPFAFVHLHLCFKFAISVSVPLSFFKYCLLQVSTLDVLMEALLFVGSNRPLHPQCNQHSSAVRLVAHYLRAKNPLISGHAKAEAEAALQSFVQGRPATLLLRLLMGETGGTHQTASSQLQAHNTMPRRRRQETTKCQARDRE